MAVINDFNLEVQWRTALVQENGQPYCFPDRFSLYFCDKYAMSAVYRWRVMRVAGEQKEPIYIGEAEDLVRRIQRVRTPSKNGKVGNTNVRLNRIFRDYLLTGKKILIDIADIGPFELNGIRFDGQALGDRFKRRALENLLLVLAQNSAQFEILNTIVEPLDKVERLLRELKPHELREVQRKYASNKAQNDR